MQIVSENVQSISATNCAALTIHNILKCHKMSHCHICNYTAVGSTAEPIGSRLRENKKKAGKILVRKQSETSSIKRGKMFSMS